MSDVRFFTDAGGQVIERRGQQNDGTGYGPSSRTLRFGGREMGTIGNNGTTIHQEKLCQ